MYDSEFQDKSYRHAYVDEHLHTSIAAQIQAMREDRGWTQAQLAARASMRQSRVSVMEDVNYTSWSVRTLARLAQAFDVTLDVCFKRFTERLADMEHFGPSALAVPSYADDLFLSIGAPAPPKLADTSPLVPLLGNLAQVVAHFNAGDGPANAPDLQQSAVALMAAVEQMYGNDSRQYREFAEWRAGFVAALSTTVQAKAEQAAAQSDEIDDRIRLLKENNDLRRQLAEVRAQAAAAIESQKQAHLATIRESAQRQINLVTSFRDAVLGWIAGERERVQQLQAATAKSDMTVDQVIREWDDSWQRVEQGVRARPVPT